LTQEAVQGKQFTNLLVQAQSQLALQDRVKFCALVAVDRVLSRGHLQARQALAGVLAEWLQPQRHFYPPALRQLQ
jgi:hypothetical protein